MSEVQVRVSIASSHILIRGFAKQCFVLELWLVLLTLKAIADSSDSCVATSLDIT